ncbi:hypothetical protein BGZ96_004533 [Linnemannia gamsii]|uniref:BTB domain-containing protein n=1 Tax=Linnemannia gamsii TaxID=64522 RepID=A0ABQ7K827_9FUNG|nr:hypothetical protein BGZ96_004533 [Linnemannia gamsii]
MSHTSPLGTGPSWSTTWREASASSRESSASSPTTTSATSPGSSATPFNTLSAAPLKSSATPFNTISATPLGSSTSPFATASTAAWPAATATPFALTPSPFAPSLAFTPPIPTASFDTTVQARTDGSSSWFIKVNYSQQGDTTPLFPRDGQIEVEVSWHNGQVFTKEKTTSSSTDLDIRQYKSMSFIPKKDPSKFVTFPIAENALLDGKPIKGSIDLDKVSTEKHAFDFYVVLSTAPTVARAPQPLPSKNHDILPRFLKDPHSVDICFVFPNDRDAADVGVWAHRVILNQTKVFAKMIDDAVQKAANVGPSFCKEVPHAAMKATTIGGTQQENVDEGKMVRDLSNHEDETSSVTSFTDIGSQADDSAGDQSFSEPVTPDLSRLQCELRAVEGNATATVVKGDSDNNQESTRTENEKTAGATTGATATTDTPKSDKETALTAGPRTLTFVVDQVSSTVFLALLQYIYTGEINLTPNTQHFTFSSTKPKDSNSADCAVSDAVSHHDRENAQWLPNHPLTRVFGKAPMYEDLMLAADLYGIDELATFCQQNVELSFSPLNVSRILFDVAPRYPRIKAPALAYMVKSRATLFTKDTDPFKDYRNHSDCYSMMLEVVQLLAASK